MSGASDLNLKKAKREKKKKKKKGNRKEKKKKKGEENTKQKLTNQRVRQPIQKTISYHICIPLNAYLKVA